MTYAYTPNKSYGPLRFGMSPKDAQDILGEPSSFKSPFENIPLDEEMERFVGGLRVMEFARTRKDHEFPQLTFDNGKLVAITLFDIRKPYPVASTDLFASERETTLRALAAEEDTYYGNEEYFYFPKAGVQIPSVKLRRKLPYVTFVQDSYEASRLKLNFLAPTTALGKRDRSQL